LREIPYHVVLSGEAVLEDEHGPPQTLHPGDIVLFPRGAPHRLHDGSGRKARPVQSRETATLTIKENKVSGEGIDLLCGTFLVASVQDRLLRDHLPDRLVVHAGELQTPLVRLVELMRDEANEERPAARALLNYLSGALFAMTLRFASESEAPPRGLLALARRSRLQPALAAMFDSPQEPWTLPSLAALCNMSRATFVRHFEETVGRSASDLLTEVRMTLAARQLQQTDLPTAAIGEAVGYRSEAAFQRAFKQQMGVTPAKWRAAATTREDGSEVQADSEAEVEAP